MIHLTAADYRVQPWSNGRGQTVELARADDAQGMVWRLSVAAVVQDGPFSRFPGINRSLTVIGGPGFTLRGPDTTLRAMPLIPVAFSGDIDLMACGVTAPSDDFNVMVRATLPPPVVAVVKGAVPAGGLVALYAVNAATIDGRTLQRGDLILTRTGTMVTGGTVVAARITGV